MTALAQYQRLEAPGIWRPAPDGRLQDVIVSFGDVSLILRDPRSELPLAHWSLPAVIRLNPGQQPAIFAPCASDRDEVVEIDDTLMIEAIEKVHTAIAASRPHPGRVRGLLTGTVVLLLAAAAAIWLPDVIRRHAARIAPMAQREQLGHQILADLQRVTGPSCNRPAGSAMLDRLSASLLGAQGRIVVLPATLRGARALPGRIMVIGDDLVAGEPSPAAAAGHVLAADVAAQAEDPMLAALRHARLGAVLRMLTSGEMPGGALAGYGELLLARPIARPDDEALLERLQQAGVSSEPYARSLDPSGESVLALIEADPFRTEAPHKPVLTDGEWVQLQQICDI